MWHSLSLRRRRDLSFNHRCFIGDASPEFNPTSVILCLSLKTYAYEFTNLSAISADREYLLSAVPFELTVNKVVIPTTTSGTILQSKVLEVLEVLEEVFCSSGRERFFPESTPLRRYFSHGCQLGRVGAPRITSICW